MEWRGQKSGPCVLTSLYTVLPLGQKKKKDPVMGGIVFKGQLRFDGR